MERLKITDARMVTPCGIVEHATVLIADGRIAEAGQTVSRWDCAVIDAAGRYLSPGFIDIHVHGGGGHDFMDGTVDAFLGVARTHALHGTTTLLPTTLACGDEELFAMLSTYRKARAANTDGATMPGLHLEGPYFSLEQKGAQDPRYIIPPVPEHFGRILEAGGCDILRWSMAPEVDGALELGKELSQRGILPSVAHTDSFFEQIEEAMAYGFTHMTHFYSAMQGVRRIDGMRRAGAVEAGYILDGLTVEIIGDGIHLPPPLLRMVYKNIGPRRTALITDAMRAAGTQASHSILGSLKGGVEVLVEGGVAWLMDRSAFAGSICTMDRTVRTMVQQAQVPLIDAIAMATATPAEIMGFQCKGRIEPGMDADLVLFDEDIHASCTVIGGRQI